jgi:hypothetical protein
MLGFMSELAYSLNKIPKNGEEAGDSSKSLPGTTGSKRPLIPVVCSLIYNLHYSNEKSPTPLFTTSEASCKDLVTKPIYTDDFHFQIMEQHQEAPKSRFRLYRRTDCSKVYSKNCSAAWKGFYKAKKSYQPVVL